MFNPVTKTFQYGDQKVSIETGKIARQATGSVMIHMGQTQVLATVVGRKKANPNADFFPLTVNYQEKNLCGWQNPRRFFQARGTSD